MEDLLQIKQLETSGHFLKKKKIIIKLKEKVVFGTIVTFNTKVMVIKTATYHQMNILIKLELT